MIFLLLSKSQKFNVGVILLFVSTHTLFFQQTAKAQGAPERIHSWRQVLDSNLNEIDFLPFHAGKDDFRLVRDTIHGVGVRWFSPDINQWQKKDAFLTIKPSLPNLMQLSAVSEDIVISLMHGIGRTVNVEGGVQNENELHLENDTDLRLWEVHNSTWSSEIIAVGSNAVEEIRSLQLEADFFTRYGLAVKTDCLVDRDLDGQCHSYLCRLHENYVFEIHFDYLSDSQGVNGYEHPTNVKPEIAYAYFSWIIFNGRQVKSLKQKLSFVEKNGAMITEVDLGVCNPIQFIFDTGASITLLNNDHFSCLSQSGKLDFLDVIEVQVADGSSTSLNRFHFDGRFQIGSYWFEGFDVVFMPDIDNLLGESIWGQYESMDINLNQKTIHFE